jgi:hypothetical protein
MGGYRAIFGCLRNDSASSAFCCGEEAFVGEQGLISSVNRHRNSEQLSRSPFGLRLERFSSPFLGALATLLSFERSTFAIQLLHPGLCRDKRTRYL